MVANAPRLLNPMRKNGLSASRIISSARRNVGNVSFCSRQLSTLGTSSTCPYSIGLTLMSTRFGSNIGLSTARSADGPSIVASISLYLDVAMPVAAPKVNSTSLIPALLKLNFVGSNGCATWSILNSVGRFLSARPSFSCATNPSSPGSTLVAHSVTSYRNSPSSARSSQCDSRMSSNALCPSVLAYSPDALSVSYSPMP
mmetsp:Transcript_12441/g.28249  ORF Transcript_12441/g.28249 Transcript_12441/m.28249 type:complete len:200 (-) Transcript_12441:1211-1810(-)